MSSPLTKAEAVRLMRRSPVEFAYRALRVCLWSKQRDILSCVGDSDYTAVKSCHETGKTFVAALLVLWWFYTRPDSETITTAPTWKQVETQLWKEINRLYARLPDELRNLATCTGTKLVDKERPWHTAFGMSTDQADRFQGHHAPDLMVVVDEAAGVSDDIYLAIDTLGGASYREFLIGNPTNSANKFYRAFQNADLGYRCFSIPADETPNFTGEPTPDSVRSHLVTPEKVARWGADWGEDSPAYIARVKAQFPEGGDDKVLVPLSWTEAAQRRAPSVAPNPVVQLGIDVAHFGADRNAGVGRIGNEVVLVRSLPGKTSTQEAAAFALECEAALRALCDECNVPHTGLAGLVDYGGNPGVADLLIERDAKTWSGINFGSAARDPERFGCLRDEMYGAVRERFKPGGTEAPIAITATGAAADRMLAQVSSIEYGYDARLRVKVESKEHMREKRKLPSPDEADALVLAFCPARPFSWADLIGAPSKDDYRPTPTPDWERA